MKYPQLVSMPSAVSDWLEEQLEARGIDAVVYTRYVLSLLHRDSSDLICPEPDQDIHTPKEGRGRKRLRRSTYSEWWGHVRRDVEQLRRSAAVECLMSAADQKCGIESLVDELCEKLKDFKSSSENKENKASSDSIEKPELIDSPLDLARRYYAAFPPLKSGSNIITLIPHIYSKKKSSRKLNRSTSCGEKYSLKSESENMKSRSGGKPRISFARKKVDFGFTRSMEKSDISDWDVYFKNRQNRADEGYSTSDTNVEEEKEDKHLAKLVAKFDRSIEALWNDESENCDNQNEYQDLPVDLQELLASPTVEILNNNKKTVNNKSFIQCGTNITSSIWSDYSDDNKSLYDSYCNLYNESLEADKILGDQFNYLNIDKNIQENETNLLYENLDNNNLKTDYLSLPWELSYPIDRLKWSSAENLDTNPPFKRVSKQVNESLITLNHNEEESCFKEVVPKQVLGLTTFTAGGPALASLPPEAKEQEEDLLTSARTHFRPIKQEDTQQGYADGTTFAIRSSLERVNYKRSESGMLLLESEFDTPKKYMEYRVKDAQPEQMKWDTDNDSCYSIEREFILKFCIKQNEKCCQTECISDPEIISTSPQEVPAKKRVLCDPEEFFFPGDEELLCDMSSPDCECDCSHVRTKVATNLEPLFNASTEMCAVHGTAQRSESSELDTWINNWKKCDKCNNNWSSVWLKPEQEGIWKSGGNGGQPGASGGQWQGIWSSSEELCRTCGVPAGSGATSRHYTRLREELSQDGEQLLSDLSCLQRCYMEQLPVTEVSCDLNDCLQMGPPSAKERKRRHSSSLRTYTGGIIPATAVTRNSWTNNVRAVEYLCEQSPFMPSTLRPVTL